MILDRSLDELKGLNIRLLQPSNGFRVNVDTILLAGFSKVRRGERVCELGCAHGAVSLILAGRGDVFVTGLDIQPDLIDIAQENASINGLADRVSFVHRDLREIRGFFPPQSFDVVVSNPPYGDPKRHRMGIREEESLSRHGVTCSLEDIGSSCSYLLRHGGRAYTVFTSERMVGLLDAMRYFNVEPKAILPVYPNSNKDSSVFLMKSIRGASPGLRILPPLYIGDDEGKATDDLLSYYTMEGCPCP